MSIKTELNPANFEHRCDELLWVKIVEMLQQNWATIVPDDNSVRVYFISDCSEIFDEILFANASEAEAGLVRNGFKRFGLLPNAREFLVPPEPPYERGRHPNGSIYSSGKFWG